MRRFIYLVALLLVGKISGEECTPACEEDLFRKDEQVFSGHVEFLYWTVEEGSLDYALKMKNPSWGDAASTVNYAQGKFQTAGYGFDPGFRVALSFYRAPRYWEVKWQYLRATFRGTDHANAPEGADLFLTGTWPQIASAPLSEAKSKLHFNYNTFDNMLARVFIPNPHLRIRFIGSATVAWMSQDWVVRYLSTAGDTTRIKNHWNFAGGGLKLGTTVDWFWSSDVYITATGFAGLLMGSYHNQAKQTANHPAPGAGSYNPSLPLRNAKMENIRSTFTGQLSFGPSLQKNFKNARLEAFAGYEITLWTNLQELYRSTAGAPSAAKETWMSSSAIALQGVTVRLSGDF